VTVRPLVLANGDEEFAEVFLDGVVVSDDDMLGDEGDGWGIALSTISYERGAVDVGYQAKFERFFSELVDGLAGQEHSSTVQEEVGEIDIALEVFRLHCLRGLSRRADGSEPGFESSVDKLVMTDVEQRMVDVALASLPGRGPDHERWFGRYLYARAGSIYGGSAQIQKSILAERVLGLRFR
jgi:alkylation response protein AidB-like acyl-CoA dehydrogenase